jgi:2-amino-4-hydroxy-6-hydroxymethyldihydropteridine diphosphokinase
VNVQIVRAYIGLGGNLGDVSAMLESAFAALDALPNTRLTARSSIYRSPAWGMTDQPAFLNAVAALDTALDQDALLAELLRIERAAGRERVGAMRWGPRTLDLDLLLYADAVIDQPGLRVPHPHLHERAFVLLPLVEIAPDAIVPGRGRVADLAAVVDADGIEALG